MKKGLSALLILTCMTCISVNSYAFTLSSTKSLNNSYGTLTNGFSDSVYFGSNSGGEYFDLSGTSFSQFTGIPGQNNQYKNNWKTLQNPTDKFIMGYTQSSFTFGVSLDLVGGGITSGVTYTETTACDSIVWPNKGMYNWCSNGYSANGDAREITFIKHSYSALATFYGASNLAPIASDIEYK